MLRKTTLKFGSTSTASASAYQIERPSIASFGNLVGTHSNRRNKAQSNKDHFF